MCDKLPYCAVRIDPCLLDTIGMLSCTKYRTILSCCGHGKYPKTIVALDLSTHQIIEVYSGYVFGTDIRKPKRYYKRDTKGYYYIPEISKEKI